MHDEYLDYPPRPYLEIVLQQCPEAAIIYIELWFCALNMPDYLLVVKKEIQKKFFISPTKFKGLLFQLVSTGLASVDETPNTYIIEFTPYDSENDIQEWL